MTTSWSFRKAFSTVGPSSYRKRTMCTTFEVSSTCLLDQDYGGACSFCKSSQYINESESYKYFRIIFIAIIT